MGRCPTRTIHTDKIAQYFPFRQNEDDYTGTPPPKPLWVNPNLNPQAPPYAVSGGGHVVAHSVPWAWRGKTCYHLCLIYPEGIVILVSSTARREREEFIR